MARKKTNPTEMTEAVKETAEKSTAAVEETVAAEEPEKRNPPGPEPEKQTLRQPKKL